MKCIGPGLLACLAGICPAFAEEAGADKPASISVSLRLLAESRSADFLGPGGPPRETALLSRALVRGDWSPSPAIRTRLELGWHEQAGRRFGPGVTDVNGLDIHQAWIEFPASDQLTVRLGRQELPLGSGRLISARDGPNIRLAFDGIVADFRSGGWESRLFAVSPVAIRSGAFDDRRDTGQSLYGIYATAAEGAAGMDAFLVHRDRTFPGEPPAGAREHRTSAGLRVHGRHRSLDYNFEPVLQFGSRAGRRIQAWSAASDTGWSSGTLRFGLKANAASGDRDPDDGLSETFDPLFPNFSYLSYAAILSPQNQLDLHPNVKWTISDTAMLEIGAAWFWRLQPADFVYRVPGRSVAGSAQGSGRYIGAQWEAALNWRAADRVRVTASLTHWQPGTVLDQLGAVTGQSALVSMTVSY